MSSIRLTDVSLNYPLLGAYTRSLKQSMLQSLLGGRRSQLLIQEKITFIDALKNINLELNSGDRLGLIGRNGSGKSTLLKILAGIYSPSTGKLEINGDISPLLGINVGMNPLATGYENIKFRCLLHGLNQAKTQTIIKDVEEFTELGRFLSMPVKTYSSGMNVRLSFALATVMTPDILIVDEVVGVGDAHFLEKAKARLHHLVESSNILVMASHSDDIIEKFCNKILWLDQGSIVKVSDTAIGSILAEYKQACMI